jgi:protein-disulfide isomerase
MNTKRTIFWACFLIIMALIVWGLIVAMNKTPGEIKLSAPAPVTVTDHIRGASTSPVTVIEYGDFQCPACAIWYSTVERLASSTSTPIQFIFRHFPLYPLPHKNAFIASQAAEAAGRQGKFWDMYSLLYENQTAWENSTTATAIFERYATRIGIDLAQYKKDFDSPEIKAHIQADKDEGTAIGVGSTPTFFVNGKAIQPKNYEDFKSTIEAAARESAK